DELERLAFHLLFQDCRLRVEVKAGEATYRQLSGPPLAVRHYGDELLLSVDSVVSRPISIVQMGPRPSQPPGRAPAARR
ncbi:MAG TPA: glycosyl hydrolase family 65 protein, partial [Ktedonobacteraceae bacterium]|nr:glycosyl hydrolase family 65 protein [Ktedonobacteraceae bacterium]